MAGLLVDDPARVTHMGAGGLLTQPVVDVSNPIMKATTYAPEIPGSNGARESSPDKYNNPTNTDPAPPIWTPPAEPKVLKPYVPGAFWGVTVDANGKTGSVTNDVAKYGAPADGAKWQQPGYVAPTASTPVPNAPSIPVPLPGGGSVPVMPPGNGGGGTGGQPAPGGGGSTQPTPAPGGGWGAQPVGAVTNRTIDKPTSTIEGRIQNLLSSNNPLIIQAGERVKQQFAARGLMDSSMAVQAANEAMIAKAVEIAGPDAQAYQQASSQNQTEANKFAYLTKDLEAKLAMLDAQTQADVQKFSASTTAESARVYMNGVSQIQSSYSSEVAAIQASDLDGTVKSARIASALQVRNQSLDAWNAAARALSGWHEEWLVPITVGSGQVGGVGAASATTPAPWTPPSTQDGTDPSLNG